MALQLSLANSNYVSTYELKFCFYNLNYCIKTQLHVWFCFMVGLIKTQYKITTMAAKVGNTAISAVYVGGTTISAMYVGTTQVYP